MLERHLDELLARPAIKPVNDLFSLIVYPRFTLSYHGEDNRILMRKLSSLACYLDSGLRYTAPHCRSGGRGDNGLLRIGFISSHFRRHTISHFTRGLVEHLDRERFRVIVAATEGGMDDGSNVFQSISDDYLILPSDLDQARRMLSDREFDIVFYPDIGIGAMTYYLAFSRLAPVQVVTWGHPETTGIDTIDYFLSSRDLETMESDDHYTERLIRLEHLPTYYYRPESPADWAEARRLLGIGSGEHLYFCSQLPNKFHPDFDVAVSEILRGDPAGVLVVIKAASEYQYEALGNRWRHSMPDVLDRVRFVENQTRRGYLTWLSASDVMLDPFYFGGGNTLYESFSVGTPVVTLPGKHMRGRVAYACYRRMGLDACIAGDLDEYVGTSLRIGREASVRVSLHRQILDRCDVLYEQSGAVREIEAFLIRAFMGQS